MTDNNNLIFFFGFVGTDIYNNPNFHSEGQDDLEISSGKILKKLNRN